jgi:mannose-6-phosphate isomerase-like protein (cupin superfamily)
MIDPRSTGPNEMGGSALAGGESRSLGRGDVIIVPNGTTHWFKDVNGAINYATVKIREAAPPSGSPSPVSYWKGPEVKGGSLFEGTEGAKYRVAASRRNKTGTSEVHGIDTDVVVVLDGSATFVTGGTVTEEKTLRPNEIGGAGIEKGEPHQFAKGDVIIVPAGTPHWFKNVDGVINYFSIKVQ